MKQYSMDNTTTDIDIVVFELRTETKVRSLSFSQFLFTTVLTKKAWNGFEPWPCLLFIYFI